MTRAVYDTMVFFQWATLPPQQPEHQRAATIEDIEPLHADEILAVRTLAKAR